MATYTVKPGDTLAKIGASLGVDWRKITGFRSGKPSLIYPGEVLTIPEAPTPALTPSGYDQQIGEWKDINTGQTYSGAKRNPYDTLVPKLEDISTRFATVEELKGTTPTPTTGTELPFPTTQVQMAEYEATHTYRDGKWYAGKEEVITEDKAAEIAATKARIAETQAAIEAKKTELHDKYTDAGVSDTDATKLVEAGGTISPTDLGYDSTVVAKINGVGDDLDQTTFNAGDLANQSTVKLSSILPGLAGAGTVAGSLDVSSGIAGILALLDTSTQADTEYADINKKINDLLSTIEEDKEGFEDVLAEYQIPEIREQLDELNLDIARIKGEIGAFDVETQQGFAGITAQAIPQGLLVGQASQYQRQRDAGRAGLASELAANAALQQAYVQNLTIATGLAEASVNYKWQGISNTISALQVQLDLAQDIMEREDAKQLNIINILLQDQMNQINDQKTRETAMNSILITAAANGADLSLIRAAQATGDAIQATSILQEYLREPVEVEAPKTVKTDAGTFQWNPATSRYDIPIDTGDISTVGIKPELDSFDETIATIDELLVHKGIGNALRTIPWLGALDNFWDRLSGTSQDFIGTVQTLISKETLAALIALKAKGGTLGALSDKEAEMLRSAANRLGSWAVMDSKTGKIRYFNIDRASFKEELEAVKTHTEKLKEYAIQAAGVSTTGEPVGEFEETW